MQLANTGKNNAEIRYTQKAVYSQSEQLARCNARHLDLAEKLEQAVKQRLERADKLSENGLRWLSTVAETAQRIARLALGAATENIHCDLYAHTSDEELAQELKRLDENAACWKSARNDCRKVCIAPKSLKEG